MSLFGSLYTGVSALTAQSAALSTISNNIANVSTTGFKGDVTNFSSLVTQSNFSSEVNPGGVRASPVASISQQGLIGSANLSTNMAISGNGFFLVNSQPQPFTSLTSSAVSNALNGTGTASNLEPLYTRVGTFDTDNQGYLVNSNGFYLMGWPLDQNGNIPQANADVSSTQPVNVAVLSGLAAATSTVSMGINLNASQALGATSIAVTNPNDPTALATALGEPAQSWAAQTLSFNGGAFTVPITNNESLAQIAAAITTAGTATGVSATVVNGNQIKVLPAATTIANGATTVPDTFTIPQAVGTANTYSTSFNISMNGGTPVSITVDSSMSMQDLANEINGQTLPPGTSPNVTATVDSNNHLVLNPVGVNNTLTITNGSSNQVVNSLFGSATVTQNGYDFRRVVRIYDSLGTPRDLNVNFKKTNTNQWSVEIDANDPTVTQPVNPATGTPAAPPTGVAGFISSGTLTFNSDGTLNSISGLLSGTVSIPWASTTGAGTQQVQFGFGNASSSGQATTANNVAMTQFASDYNVVAVNQNGAQLGQRTGVTIDDQGDVVAAFSNGTFRKLFKLPVVTFSDPNGMQALSGGVYQQTTNSGVYNLRQAGTGGAGTISGSSLEQSNVDLATEFTRMIVTQRAYSAGTKVISTSDTMLNDLLQIQ